LKIDVVIPTLGRREKLFNCLGSIEQARQLLDCYSYVYVYYSKREEFDFDRKRLSLYRNILPRMLEKEYKASTFWNDHLKESNSDMMIYLNDDVILEMNCLLRVKAIMDMYYPDLDGVVAITQENIPADQACKTAFGAIGSKFANRFKDRQVFCPDYERFYLDSHLLKYVEKYNKLFYSTDKEITPLLTHLHPAFFNTMKDETHDLVRTHLNKDKKTDNIRNHKNYLWGEDYNLVNEN
jgi:hypothetical protein